MPLRITKKARFYYLEIYVRGECPPAALTRIERKIVLDLQRAEDKREQRPVPVLTQQEEDFLTVLTGVGTDAYKQVIQDAKVGSFFE